MEKKICRENDIYHIWKKGKFEFTLNLISKITGLAIPDCFSSVADKAISDMSHTEFRSGSEENGLQVFFMWIYKPSMRAKYIEFAKNGAVVISYVELVDENGVPVPAIVLPSAESVRNVWTSLAQYVRNVIQLPTIGITGSVGKTTLTLMMKSIFSERYKVFTSGGNMNTSMWIIRQILRNYDSSYDIHVQECGGGVPGRVERQVKLLQPDAFAISNVLPHHLDKYGDIQGVLKDKSSFDLCAKDDAFGVINIDDDNLRNHSFKHKIVTCGIEHTEADYVAKNVRYENCLCLDVVHGKETVPLRVNIPGLHNAYNALLAFAMAKEWGLSNEEIVHGIEKYGSGDIRQNIKEIAGRTWYIDCFNICAASIHSSLATLNEMHTKEDGRRIAVLGGENGLGEKHFTVNYQVGLELDQYDKIDEFVFYGLPMDSLREEIDHIGDAYAVYQGAKRVLKGKKVSFVSNTEELVEKIKKDTKPDDIILLKGIYYLPMYLLIDKAYGSSYYIRSQYSGREDIQEGEFYAKKYDRLWDNCNIAVCKWNTPNLCIPNFVAGSPVFRIGKNVFKKNRTIRTVELGKSLVNIGESAFEGCVNLEEVCASENVTYIEEKAFMGCTSLKRVKLLGVCHIDDEAFCNCKKLKTVELSALCTTIGPNAFKDCPDVTIIAPSKSYAAKYAQKCGLKCCLI